MNECCHYCFNDKLITAYIKKESKKTSKCFFCNREIVKLIETTNFTDMFEILFEIYEESTNENSLELFELMQKDWEIFSDITIAEKLLPKIINYDSTKRYLHKNINDYSIKEIWATFREEIKHNNRFFPKSDNINTDDLRAWTNELKASKYPDTLFRARISENNQPTDITHMGKPPKNIVSNGRANPTGISYLYMATNCKTAISEVRPHKGDFITIVKIKIKKGLNLADLRNPKKYISPFSRPEENPETLFKYISLLQHLGEELSKPILPREATLEYLPNQYLSELIKDAGFDGIIFKSSVGNGDNIVLFDGSENDINIEFQETEFYQIKNLNFGYTKIT